MELPKTQCVTYTASEEQQTAVDGHRESVDALRDQIDQTLAGENKNFAALVANTNPTFQERRQLAHLRKELLQQSAAAQAAVQAIHTLNQQFREGNDHTHDRELIGRHREPRRTALARRHQRGAAVNAPLPRRQLINIAGVTGPNVKQLAVTSIACKHCSGSVRRLEGATNRNRSAVIQDNGYGSGYWRQRFRRNSERSEYSDYRGVAALTVTTGKRRVTLHLGHG